MEAGNLETARAIVDAFSQGQLETVVDLYDEYGVLVPAAELPDAEPAVGRVALLDFMQNFLAPWDVWEFRDNDFRAQGDVVVWTFRMIARQEARGLELNQPSACVLSFRLGRVAQMRFYWGGEPDVGLG